MILFLPKKEQTSALLGPFGRAKKVMVALVGEEVHCVFCFVFRVRVVAVALVCRTTPKALIAGC